MLSEDEKMLGVMLIDIGGGTTDVAIFVNGAVVHSYVLPVGGDHITKDIAYALRAPIKVAEQIKKDHGCALKDLVEVNETFEVPHVGGARSHETSRRMLAEVIEPRLEEVFRLVQTELERSGYEDMLPAGAVLTGGSTLMPGITDLAERTFGMSARRGAPRDVGGLADVVSSPIYATGVGLVRFGLNEQRDGVRYGREASGLYTRVKDRMSRWLSLAF